MRTSSNLFVGLMSGTSLDGIDGVLASFDSEAAALPRTLASVYVPFPGSLRDQLMALQTPGEDEIHREALAANGLSALYAEAVATLLREAGVDPSRIRAIGAHGQTIRHRPECGYTRQIGNPALLAELTGIDVVADFRSRDMAAGGQGAPLVPAFHHALFSHPQQVRVVANIGGMANISVIRPDQTVIGFDTGPGNVLLDLWCTRHRHAAYDMDGAWAESGTIVPALLELLLSEPFLKQAPPKSTGRDLFHAAWLDERLTAFRDVPAADVQATLAALTTTTLADAIARYAAGASEVHVCGGGSCNGHLLASLRRALTERLPGVQLATTEALGVPPNQVEAFAFAWLAYRHVNRKPGNLAAVTGARGARLLGALYPA
jgi:anhydro-N-acetylmuramic acid kinase